jgi:hypothetical protein
MQITLNLRARVPADRFPAGGANLRVTRLVPLQMKRRGIETRLVLPGEAVAVPRTDPACFERWRAAISGSANWRRQRLHQPGESAHEKV